jgi:hypothetical protein
MTKTFLVTDPLGFSHCVHLDGTRVFGLENLGHELPPEERPEMRRRVLQALYTGGVHPPGYTSKEVL